MDESGWSKIHCGAWMLVAANWIPCIDVRSMVGSPAGLSVYGWLKAHAQGPVRAEKAEPCICGHQ